MPCYVCLSLLLLYSFLIPFLVLAFYSFHDRRISGSDSDDIVGRNDHVVRLAESVAHVPLLKRCFPAFLERKGQSTRTSFVITIGV
jgi:hypothetical protein